MSTLPLKIFPKVFHSMLIFTLETNLKTGFFLFLFFFWFPRSVINGRKLEMKVDRTTGAGISTSVEMLTPELIYNAWERVRHSKWQDPKAGSSFRQLSTGPDSPQGLSAWR